MSLYPPAQPDIRRQLRSRLLHMSPRAFEYFAGDLLVYIGLRDVSVTRYVGDKGIDASGVITNETGMISVPTAVQVKRHRQNVQRADIDRFIGALTGVYAQGVFITTAGYAAQALLKAHSSIPRIATIDGEQVASLMLRHDLGVASLATGVHLDESYFLGFEAQSAARRLGESRPDYSPSTSEADQPEQGAVEPQDDLISLRALSYMLRIDITTVRRGWIETGKLAPDATQRVGERDVYFFRRDRLDAIRRQFHLSAAPATGAEWRQTFLDYAKSRNLTKSYKPVLLKTLLRLVDRQGEVGLDQLAHAFKAFYVQRWRDGLEVEFGVPLLAHPETASHEAIKRLIVKYPLDRFVLNGFLEYDADAGTIRFTADLWQELRFYELLDVQTAADEQLQHYYGRNRMQC